MSEAARAGVTLTPTASRRRRRYAWQTAVLLLAVTLSCLFAVVLAANLPLRFDVTATREHRLSPRTLEQLAALEGPHELVLVANFAAIDRRSRQRTEDVLDAFSRAAPNLRITRIDVGSGAGLAEYDRLLGRIAELYREQINEQTGALRELFVAGARAAESARELGEAVRAVPRLPPEADPRRGETLAQYFEGRSALLRVHADDIERALRSAEQLLEQERIGDAPIPPLDRVRATLRAPLNEFASDLAGLRDDLSAIAGAAEAHPVVRDRAGPLQSDAVRLRDRVARTVAAIDSLADLPALTLARTIQRSTAAMVIGPPTADGGHRVAAIELDAMLPPATAMAPDQPRPDVRAMSEELLAGALGSIGARRAPTVVLMHGEPTRFSPDFRAFRRLADRLRLRNIRVVEWAAAMDPEPSLPSPDERPVVYVTVSTDPFTPEGAGRMGRLADAIERLVRRGENVLLSVNPSTLPHAGEPDPMTRFLEPLGVGAESGRPLLQEHRGPGGRIVSPDFYLPGPEAAHPVSGAIEGMTTLLLWPIPLRLDEIESRKGVSVEPVIVVPHRETIWGESDWLRFRQTPRGQRHLLADQPARDSARDLTEGPFTVAAAVERRLPDRPSPQRLLVVGSNGWFMDPVTEASQIIEGRTVYDSPGNLELFEAGVYWLAHQDERIVRSAAAQAVPLIAPLTAAQASVLRWVLIVVMPLMVLIVGGVWRVLRG